MVKKTKKNKTNFFHFTNALKQTSLPKLKDYTNDQYLIEHLKRILIDDREIQKEIKDGPNN